VCFSAAEGRCLAWGRSDFGQTGGGLDATRPHAVDVGGAAAAGTACGSEHSLVRTASGELWAFGWGEHAQLGTGHAGNETRPQRVAATVGTEVLAVAAGGGHSLCVVRNRRHDDR
jgi:alpha-tubulin suppressor-like RCC1 family protein